MFTEHVLCATHCINHLTGMISVLGTGADDVLITCEGLRLRGLGGCAEHSHSWGLQSTSLQSCPEMYLSLCMF